MNIGAALIVTSHVAELIGRYSAPWGTLTLAVAEAHHAVGAIGAGERTNPGVTDRRRIRGHFLDPIDARAGSGLWYRADPDLHEAHRWLRRIQAPSPIEMFKAFLVADTFRDPGPDGATITLTYAPDADAPWAAWAVTRELAWPTAVAVLPPREADPLNTLGPGWPLAALRPARVTLVGTGSIGSAAAHALAGYGVGHLTLVDDDRLEWHNLVRHRSGYRDIGRYKVDALADDLRGRWTALHVDPRRENVVFHADRMRALFADSDLIVCAADGVAPRRVVSHLARRTGRAAMLACVLLDGAVGEVLRLRPWPRYGCLLCNRAALLACGALDPEPGLDSDYGQGERHRPMTAVGPDLHLVADLAAKLAVATLLEADGRTEQVVRGDTALVGLRPEPLVAPPFDLAPGELRWLPVAPQRPDCPTCGAE